MQNLLLLSTGSKVGLTRIAHRSCHKRGIALHGIDCDSNVPTKPFVDVFHRIEEEDWLPSVLEYCRNNNIGLVIPTRHSDLSRLARGIQQFSDIGVNVALSSPKTIDICIGKLNTHAFLTRNGFPTPDTLPFTPGETEELSSRLPLIVKPAQGSGSHDIQIVESIEGLRSLSQSGTHIAQSLAKGDEYTINVYISSKGKCLCAIPHRRVVVEGGESVQAITVRKPQLMELGHAIAEALPGARGPLNIQAFLDSKTGEVQVIEINPRLGGGFPLVDRAKGCFIEWLIQEALENKDLPPLSDWTSGLRMMRYRDAIFDFPDL